MEAIEADLDALSNFGDDNELGLNDVEFTPSEENDLNNMMDHDMKGLEEEGGTEAAVATIQHEASQYLQRDDYVPEGYLITADGALVPIPDEDEEEVEVETNIEDELKSTEKLDRSSPDLWPQNLATKAKQVLMKSSLKTGEPSHSTHWAQGLDPEDINLLHQFGSLTSSSLVEEVKKLQNIAYTLSLDEEKELARGKLLHALDRV